MDKGAQIDKIYGQLMSLANDPDMNFTLLRSDWGKLNGLQYNDKKAMFYKSMRQLAKKCPVKYYNDSFYMFNGKIYEPVDSGVLDNAYGQMVETLAIAPMFGNTTARKECFTNTIKFYNSLEPRFDIVAFSNGVLDLSKPKHPVLHPFSPDFHVTYYHPYPYNEKAKCERWQTFLREVLPDKNSRIILQMFLGLGLVQRGVAYDPYNCKNVDKIELCLLLVGGGANGKSVIFEVMRALYGKDRISYMDYDTLTADGDEGMRGRYPIRNAIFNWSSDSNPKKFGRKNTGVFKRLVSGEPVAYRKLGQDIMDIGTVPYLIFNLNELPYPDDSSLGLIRRLQFVSFDVTIPKERQNPELASILIKNEISGIFNWVLRGTNELWRRFFKFPSAEGSQMALLKTLLGASPVLAWLKAYGLRNEKLEVKEMPEYITAGDLYQSFERFCRDNDLDEHDIPSPSSFGRILRDKCSFHKKRTSTGVIYETFGATLGQLRHPLFITDVEDFRDKAPSGESFIKDDD